MRINLTFSIEPYQALFAQGINVRVIRLIGRVRFWTGTDWTADREAIIDTGSPVSLLPFSLWQGIEAEILSTAVPLRGLAPQRTATVTARLAEITATFRDGENVSPPLVMRAYLVDSDKIPLLIGFEDVLTACLLVSDFPSDIAYLEFDEESM